MDGGSSSAKGAHVNLVGIRLNRTRNPNLFFAISTSQHAEHSNAEPQAISKNRQRLETVYFPFPSAIFNGIEVDALSTYLMKMFSLN